LDITQVNWTSDSLAALRRTELPRHINTEFRFTNEEFKRTKTIKAQNSNLNHALRDIFSGLRLDYDSDLADMLFGGRSNQLPFRHASSFGGSYPAIWIKIEEFRL
jgi:hypothetical protein